jgi:hypothetical protein
MVGTLGTQRKKCSQIPDKREEERSKAPPPKHIQLTRTRASITLVVEKSS